MFFTGSPARRAVSPGPTRTRSPGAPARAAARSGRVRRGPSRRGGAPRAGGAHAPDPRLSMAQDAEARRGLERVAESVAEIEQLARPLGLALVAVDDAALPGRAAVDDLAGQDGGPGNQRVPMPGDRGPDRGLEHQAVLERLSEAGDPLPGRKARQDLRVAHDGARAVEAAGEVLAPGEVDPGLAAEAAVEL